MSLSEDILQCFNARYMNIHNIIPLEKYPAANTEKCFMSNLDLNFEKMQ